MTRRRIYLMRHAQVAYFEDGRPVRPDLVPLTEQGREQARAAAALLEGIAFDRVVTSGLPRTLETARVVAPSAEPESWPDLREIEPGRLTDIPEDEIEQAFVTVWRDVVPEDVRFLGGETIGSLLDRVLARVDRMLGDPEWDVLLAVLHGGVNRAILSYALPSGPQRLEPVADGLARAVKDARIAEELILGVRGLGERVELERDVPRADVRVELSRLMGLLHRMLEIGEPRAQILLDPVANWARAIVELEGRRGKEAAAREDLPLRVVDHVVAERPYSRETLRRRPGRGDHLGDEPLRRVLDGRQL
jgi:broad specificity phosphatase PhoE